MRPPSPCGMESRHSELWRPAPDAPETGRPVNGADDAATEDQVRRSSISLPVIVGIAIFVLVQQAILIRSWFSRYVSDDYALLWAAARSWGQLEPHQPNFWGQSYGTTLESIPTEVLHWIGVGYPTGLPIVLSLMHLGSWWIPAAAAWHRGHRLLAAVAVAAPALFTTEYVVAASVYCTATGRFVGGIVVALIIVGAERPRWVAVSCGLAACAFLADSSSALLTAPACAYGVVACLPAVRESGRWRQNALIFIAAMTPAAVWVLFTERWYQAHPGDALHPATAFDPQIQVLLDNLRNPTRMLGPYAPELLRAPYLVLAVVLALGIAVAVQRRAAIAVAYGVFVLVLAMILSLSKTYGDLGVVYFQAARLILPMPVGIWFIAYGLSWRTLSPRWDRLLAYGLVVIVAATGCFRIVTWSDRGGVLEQDAVSRSSRYPEMPAAELTNLCDRVAQAAAKSNADVAIFESRIAAYGCAALIGPDLTTAFPEYERRRWVLEALDRPADRSTILFVGPPAACTGIVVCEQLDVDIVAVELGGRSLLQLAHDMGITVRSF